MAGLPQVTEINTTTTKGVILVSWKAPVQPVRGYMIDWTHDGNQYYWKESKYNNATLSGRLDNNKMVNGCQIARWMFDEYFMGANMETWNEQALWIECESSNPSLTYRL